MPRKRTTPVPPAIQRVLDVARLAAPRDLAKRFGFPVDTVASWDKRGQISGKGLRRIAAELGVPVAALMVDEDSVHQTSDEQEVGVGAALVAAEGMKSYVAGASPIVLELADEDRELRFQVVPRYDVRASAGPGNGSVDEEQIGEVAFEVNWMRRHLGRSGRGFASIEVRGDSMQPTLLNGDEIIIDRHVHRVDVNGIYVIALRGDLLVKRIQRMLDGSLVVKSDNAAYEPETISAERAEEFRVVGRMVWPRVR